MREWQVGGSSASAISGVPDLRQVDAMKVDGWGVATSRFGVDADAELGLFRGFDFDAGGNFEYGDQRCERVEDITVLNPLSLQMILYH